jgi:hypothetical protein
MSGTVLASILHGAYGDYYEQAVCLKHFRLTHPNIQLKLFAASPHRLAELRFLDFSWADCFEPWTELPKHKIDGFFQFQVLDAELRAEVLSKLSPEAMSKLDSQKNRRPWKYLRSILPLRPEQQLGLNALGRETLPTVMQQSGLRPDIFNNPTIGFLWRHRSPGGYVKPIFQPSAERLVAKYSHLFARLIEEYGCHVVVCGMKVLRTPENRYRIDAKYPEYGLDLPAKSSTHLRGLSWPLELEILSRCTWCVANPSGFSEALWIKRGANVFLIDPPPHYLARAMWYRGPFFHLSQPGSLLSAIASRSSEAALSTIRANLDRWSRQSRHHMVPTLQNPAP